MATRTVNQGFEDFLKRLTPSSTESKAAKDHRASIEGCLKNNFNMKRFFRTGSFGNGTSISGHSDVDYFAEIPTCKLKESSGTTLSEVRDVLDTRFPKTNVRVNCPAVLIPFGTDAKEVPRLLQQITSKLLTMDISSMKFLTVPMAGCVPVLMLITLM